MTQFSKTVRRHECPLIGCDKKYQKPCQLREHMRSHTNDKPFVCPEIDCGKRFNRVCHMNVHRWTHRRDKPLGCDQCDKRFVTKQQLSRHRNTHLKRGPPKSMCTYDDCTAIFDTQCALTEHLLDTHILSMIAPAEEKSAELKIPSSDQDKREIEVFFQQCEEIYNRDYAQEASTWVDLQCKHCECGFWMAPSYSELIAHYDETHGAVPVSLLQFGFQGGT
ncbi:LADA_0E12574g1_1 [Lachancea dasiensis]|uniref:LADA_0E12574g1_1 n=1 Tax=Lachancea dasiensis TaxID=1072105 RepID=A0A1G4JF56_9SACH|nr:LADA_0E12574g1_1 [Lachancea dasiensis]